MPGSTLAGVVLAGGASSRFGRDKAEEPYGDRKLIDWSIAALDPFCATLFVAGRAHATRESVADRPRPGLGPLGGLAGALTAARARGYDRLLSLPCDTPRLPAGLLAHLAASPSAAFVASCPVIGIWPSAEADRLAYWLDGNGPRSVGAWAQAIGAKPIQLPEPILNINRRADMDELPV